MSLPPLASRGGTRNNNSIPASNSSNTTNSNLASRPITPLLFPRDYLQRRTAEKTLEQRAADRVSGTRKSHLLDGLVPTRASTPGVEPTSAPEKLPPRAESTEPRWARLPGGEDTSRNQSPQRANNGGASGPLITGQGHLQNALELVISILSRLAKEGKVMTETEQDLVEKVGKSASMVNAKARLGGPSVIFSFDRLDGSMYGSNSMGSPDKLLNHTKTEFESRQNTEPALTAAAGGGSQDGASSNQGDSPSSQGFIGKVGVLGALAQASEINGLSDVPPSPNSLTASASGNLNRPGSSQRTLGLLSKLRNVSSTSSVYKKLVESKASLESISEFSIHAAAATTHAEACELLSRQILRSNVGIEATVYVVDNVHDIIYNPLDNSPNRLIAKLSEKAHRLTRAAAGKEYFISDHIGYLPVRAEGGVSNVPLFVVEVKNPSKTLATSDAVKSLEALCGIGSLSFRNIRLIENVRWQVEKAEAMLTMARQLSRDNLNENVLMSSIIQTARQLTESDRCSVFLVRGQNLQAYFEDGTSVKMPLKQGIAGHVATTGETLNIIDAYEDSRFNKAVDKATGYRTKTMLCMPVRYEGSIVAVAQLVNKLPKRGNVEFDREFNTRDEELFETFSTFIGVCLRNCRVNMELVREKMKSETVLDVVTHLANSDIREVDSVVSQMMHGAKKLVNADRATLFLIDKEHSELYSKLADSTAGQEIRFPIGKGIAGDVAESGVAENIEDAYNDSRFNQEFDKKLGYRTKSILCEPIHCRGELLAVAQLVNKLEDDDSGAVQAFQHADSETFRTFALFAGLSLSNAALLSFAVQAGREAMSLSGFESGGKRPNSPTRSISRKEMTSIFETQIPEWATQEELQSNEFDVFRLREDRSTGQPQDTALRCVVSLIMSTGLPQKFGCEEETLTAFVWHCRKRYRIVPYHNFWHAVDVCQTMHTFLFKGKVKDLLTDLETFVLFIIALSHDLDHMGVNNSFHLKTDSPLGMLSSASGNNSVLEVHHCNLAIEILEDPIAAVFKKMDTEDKSKAYKCLIDTILATDMARHGDLLSQFDDLAEAKAFDKENADHRKLVCQMVMKAADISNVTKPFHVSRLWAISVTEEFYQQGDKEKDKGIDVLPMFDRSKAGELANGQIGFINFIAKKFFNSIVRIFTGMQWTVEQIDSNVESWNAVARERRSSLERLGLNKDGSQAVTVMPAAKSLENSVSSRDGSATATPAAQK